MLLAERLAVLSVGAAGRQAAVALAFQKWRGVCVAGSSVLRAARLLLAPALQKWSGVRWCCGPKGCCWRRRMWV